MSRNCGTERIDTLLKNDTALHEAIKKIETQLDKKVTGANIKIFIFLFFFYRAFFTTKKYVQIPL
jgi:hypothetical protein